MRFLAGLWAALGPVPITAAIVAWAVWNSGKDASLHSYEGFWDFSNPNLRDSVHHGLAWIFLEAISAIIFGSVLAGNRMISWRRAMLTGAAVWACLSILPLCLLSGLMVLAGINPHGGGWKTSEILVFVLALFLKEVLGGMAAGSLVLQYLRRLSRSDRPPSSADMATTPAT
jgi:hypothetical protein